MRRARRLTALRDGIGTNLRHGVALGRGKRYCSLGSSVRCQRTCRLCICQLCHGCGYIPVRKILLWQEVCRSRRQALCQTSHVSAAAASPAVSHALQNLVLFAEKVSRSLLAARLCHHSRCWPTASRAQRCSMSAHRKEDTSEFGLVAKALSRRFGLVRIWRAARVFTRKNVS